jgi:hypothetical protein
MYRYFVRDDISPAVRTELGRTLRDSKYQIKPLLKRIFLSRDFYSTPSTGTQIKSPVPLVVSTYKKMGLREIPTVPDFGQMTASLGQSLFDPPNVAGWAGGRTWITPATLLQRGNLFRGVLFPDLKGFKPPDRSMGGTDARIGQRISQGMGIIEATREDGDVVMNAESNMMADRDEDYNTRYAGYKGSLLAFERTKLIPRRPAALNLTSIVKESGANGPDAIVDHFARRFLSVPLSEQDRRTLVSYARDTLGAANVTTGASYEERLRELLYLVLSTPAYQLG